MGQLGHFWADDGQVWPIIFLPTPLWVADDSTMNILSTISCCSLRAISKVSTSKEKMIIRIIFLGFSRSSPDSPGCDLQSGYLQEIIFIKKKKMILYFGSCLGRQVWLIGVMGGVAATSARRCSRLPWCLLCPMMDRSGVVFTGKRSWARETIPSVSSSLLVSTSTFSRTTSKQNNTNVVTVYMIHEDY